MKLLPLGSSDFKEVIDNNFYYIDKTLLIKELFETSGKILLIPRPRRFGKTLNLSTLKYFFEITKEKDSNKYLFENTNIWKHEKYQSFLGKYPVIFITFKDVKEDTFEAAYKKTASIIAKEFERYYNTIKDSLSKSIPMIAKYDRIRCENSSESELHNSLQFLTEALYDHYQTKAIILIDEYDTPIQAAFSKDHYDKVINLIRGIFSAALKDNKFIERAILTGVTRVAKESIFSGLNNLMVFSVLNESFNDKFGFTQKEVEQLFKDQNLADKINDLRIWYNGYNFGGTTIYNPWSILSCAANKGKLEPYWVNTASTSLLEKIILSGSNDIKEKFELLLSDQTVSETVKEGIIFPGIEKNTQAVWSLLLFTGYLTCKNIESGSCELAIPNHEIKLVFNDFITNIFSSKFSNNKDAISILNYLILGDIDSFSKLFSNYVLNSTSYLDIIENESEKSYHIFVLGMLVLLNNTYQVKSNRESGVGRYDIMLIPREDRENKLGIIIEFKKADKNETLETAAQNALKQIKDRKYAIELRDVGIKKIKALGIAFKGKESLVVSEDL